MKKLNKAKVVAVVLLVAAIVIVGSRVFIDPPVGTINPPQLLIHQ